MKGHKIRLLAILLLFGILLCGCNVSNYVYTEDSLKKVAEKSLKKKYGEEFIVHSAWARDQERFFADCSPKNNSEVVFQATIYKNGKGVYDDEYPEAVVAKQVDQILKDGFKEVFGECYVRNSVVKCYNRPEMIDIPNIELGDYFSQIDTTIISYVFVLDNKISENDVATEYQFLEKELMDCVKENIKDDPVPEFGVHLYIGDEKMLEQSRNYFMENTDVRGEYDTELSRYARIIVIYENGSINISYDEYREMRLKNK